MWQDVLEVKTDRTQNEFVRGQALRDHVGVIYDVAAKDQAASECVYEVHGPSKRNEHVDESDHYCKVNVRIWTQIVIETQDIPRAMRAPKSQGPIPEKSYCKRSLDIIELIKEERPTFDWSVNNVKPRNTPKVIRLQAINKPDQWEAMQDAQGLQYNNVVEECGEYS